MGTASAPRTEATDPVTNQVEYELEQLGINTDAEVKTFLRLNRRLGNMKTVVAAIKVTLGKQYISRRRIKSATRRLYKEGVLV